MKITEPTLDLLPNKNLLTMKIYNRINFMGVIIDFQCSHTDYKMHKQGKMLEKKLKAAEGIKWYNLHLLDHDHMY